MAEQMLRAAAQPEPQAPQDQRPERAACRVDQGESPERYAPDPPEQHRGHARPVHEAGQADLQLADAAGVALDDRLGLVIERARPQAPGVPPAESVEETVAREPAQG